MKKAVIAITLNGIKQGLTLKEQIDCDIYTLEKFTDGESVLPISSGLKAFMGHIFQDYREIIMIMACGIAVRSIAPYLTSKLTDPAVVVMDEQGHFIISLISGHIGGANKLAKEVAALTGGTAVITTASDTLGLEAVDTLAERLGLVIDDFEAAKRVTACMVNGSSVGIITDAKISELPDTLIRTDWNELERDALEALIYIGYKHVLPMDQYQGFVVRLIPRKLVIGIGCKKGIGIEKVMETVHILFNDLNIDLKAISAIATIALKKNEPAICALAKSLKVPIEIVSQEEIAACEDQFEASDFVKETTGVGCVCQPAAYLVSQKGKCILPKTKLDGMTISIYEKMENGR